MESCEACSLWRVALKFLSAATGDSWVSSTASNEEKTDPVKTQDAQRRTDTLKQTISDVLLSDNLLVVAGLGTSLSVNVKDKPPIAPTMDDLWNAAKQIAGNNFDDIVRITNYKTTTKDNIELLLSHCLVSKLVNPSSVVGDFMSATEKMIVEKCRFVKADTSLEAHASFLRKAAQRSTRKARLKLITTNYDLCFERAASQINFILVDGFSHAQPQKFDGALYDLDFVRRSDDREKPDYVPNVIQFYKLHGSVDWEMQGREVVRNEKAESPLIIYPRANKFELSYDHPYLEVMSRFQYSLREPNTGLVIVGFGFNDAHIAQPIMAAIRSNIKLKVLIVDPAAETSTNSDIIIIQKLIKNGDFRTSLLASTFDEFVSLIPDLPTNEQEQHMRRILAAGA
jgi:hypothetical protein